MIAVPLLFKIIGHMKKIVGLLLILSISFPGLIAQQLRTPAPSPPQNVKQDFGLSSIELSYSRPSVKGRKIFGDLVPYDKVWRTGANQATTLVFGDDVQIGGKKIPAGKYGLLTIPHPESWTIIITKQLDVTNPAGYQADQDVVRVEAKTSLTAWSTESFTIQFANVAPSSCDLVMQWDKTMVSLPITTEIDSKIMAQIDNTVNKDNRPYYQAALYYLDNGKDLNQALAWFDKATEQNPSGYFIFYQKARCLAKLGKNQQAIATAQQSITLAKEAKNDDYVVLNEKLIATLK
jgi:Protein of unknown function (DUF2911)/Anaphase-promoting complex, cyclosome, subunit 3